MRIVLITVGLLALLLGLLGVLLPLLPTTPFLLLAAGCFSRASTRLHGWLTRLPLVGGMLDDHASGRGVSRRAKRSALLVLWTSMAITAFVLALSAGLLLLLAAVAIGASAMILRQKSAPDAGAGRPDPSTPIQPIQLSGITQ